MKNKMKSFVREFVALVNGDDATVQAEKALRSATSALRTQIAIAEGDTLKYEDRLSEAQENLKSARLNHGRTISDRDAYVDALLRAKNAVTEAEEAQEEHAARLEFLNSELELLNRLDD